MKYKCQDSDCGCILEEYQLISFINPEKRKIFKCSKCRGKVKPIVENTPELVQE